MEPVAVCVETVLHMILVDGYAVRLAEFGGFLPGVDFHMEKLYVTLEILMVKQGVPNFVQKRPFEWACFVAL